MRDFGLCRKFRFFALCGGLGTFTAQAYKTDFKKNHTGVGVAVGELRPALQQSAFFPTRSLGSGEHYFSDTDASKVLNMRFGFFRDVQNSTVEIFASHYRNTVSHFSASGAAGGSGQANLSAWGAGVQSSLHFVRTARFRSSLNLSFEYATLNLKYQLGNELKLNTTILSPGLGWRNEFWLGDMWILSLLTSYQYSMPQDWKVSEDSIFLGKTYPKGTLTDQFGQNLKSRYGGLLLQASVRLAFY